MAAEDLLVAGSVDEGATVEVDDDGEGAVVVGADNVEVEAPYSVQSLMPSHRGAGWGARNRWLPAVVSP